MVRLVATALLVLAAAACGALPRPFQPVPGEVANPLVKPRESLVIRVAALDGPPPPLARLLTRSVARELGALGIAAAARDRATSRYVLAGRARANPDYPGEPFVTLIEWSLTDSAGDVIALHTQGVEGTKDRWDYGDPGMIGAVGQAAAAAIAALLGDDEALAPRTLPPPAVLVRPVLGAPGDGDIALARAIRQAIEARGVRLTEDAAKAGYAIAGTVAVDAPTGNRQNIRIVWMVSHIDGRDVGRITQENMVPAHSLDGAWGRVAAIVAAAAAEDIANTLAAAGAPR
jgi:hypothetical protein